jgi:hypothetical protein
LGILLGSLVGGQAILLGGFAANVTISAVIALAGWGINRTVVPSPGLAPTALGARPKDRTASVD